MKIGKIQNNWWFFGLMTLISLSASRCKDDEPTLNDPDSLVDISYVPVPVQLRTWDEVNAPISRMNIPADNPLTVEGVELGRRLFYDPILSRDSSQSCASCHAPNFGFTDGKAVSTGIIGVAGKRSAMSLENVGFFTRGLFWDGRGTTLEAQALLPIEDPIELGDSWTNVEAKLRRNANYPARFRKAFGIAVKSEIKRDLVVKALAQFQRTLISTGNAKFDKVGRGEAQFSDDEFAGFKMFFDASGPGGKDGQCLHCHNSPFFSANGFFNNGIDTVRSVDDFVDKGLGAITGNRLDNGKFRAPSLRNIMLTAPYMHDGRFRTIEQVIDHYASGGFYAENLDPFLPQIRDVRLTAREKRQIIAFLQTLTDSSFVRKPEFQNPF